mmetsp:Transcript_21209/g.41282  ORF Transcript_21209/g.41282 Transcript_21209/m.41282 type:complete len:278 (+) Transcript_21209:1116-1949(+)
MRPTHHLAECVPLDGPARHMHVTIVGPARVRAKVKYLVPEGGFLDGPLGDLLGALLRHRLKRGPLLVLGLLPLWLDKVHLTIAGRGLLLVVVLWLLLEQDGLQAGLGGGRGLAGLVDGLVLGWESHKLDGGGRRSRLLVHPGLAGHRGLRPNNGRRSGALGGGGEGVDGTKHVVGIRRRCQLFVLFAVVCHLLLQPLLLPDGQRGGGFGGGPEADRRVGVRREHLVAHAVDVRELLPGDGCRHLLLQPHRRLGGGHARAGIPATLCQQQGSRAAHRH